MNLELSQNEVALILEALTYTAECNSDHIKTQGDDLANYTKEQNTLISEIEEQVDNSDAPQQSVKYFRECLTHMGKMFCELRTDVKEDLDFILDGSDSAEVIESLFTESRFIHWKYEGHDFLYDTLTTTTETNGTPLTSEISYKSGEWYGLNCTYSNDSE